MRRLEVGPDAAPAGVVCSHAFGRHRAPHRSQACGDLSARRYDPRKSSLTSANAPESAAWWLISRHDAPQRCAQRLIAAAWRHGWLSLFGSEPQILAYGSLYLRIVGPC